MKKKIAVALQGGGAHGAFSWGVLDRLLEDEHIDIRTVSGTSAGAMNAACVVQGMLEGGNKRARELLRTYWKRVSELGEKLSAPTFGLYNLDSLPSFHLSQQLSNIFSPYDLNPLNLNPFEDFLRDFFNYDLLKQSKDYQVFLAATHVKTGKIKIFSNEQVSPEVLMASACLPFLFQAVEIEGEAYWDGGYIANPAIFPLIPHAKDIIVVQLRRSYCDELPKTRAAIEDRLREITYNGCLLHEMRAIYLITKWIDEGKIPPESGIPRINMYLIKNEEAFTGLNMSSAMNTSWDFLEMLFHKGRSTAEVWIKDNMEILGTKKTKDSSFKDFIS